MLPAWTSSNSMIAAALLEPSRKGMVLLQNMHLLPFRARKMGLNSCC